MAIKANETDGNLVISLEGRIDSVNAPQVFVPGVISPESLEVLKGIALSYVDEGVEPIVF